MRILPEYARLPPILPDFIRFTHNVKEYGIIIPDYHRIGHNPIYAIIVTSAQIMRDYERLSFVVPMPLVIQSTLIYMNQVGILYLPNEYFIGYIAKPPIDLGLLHY